MQVRSGFSKPILPNQFTDVMSLILDALQSSVGQHLFEGLTQISITESVISLTFRFSSNEDHIAKVEAQIGRRELHSHRANFVLFVFARVDEVYKLDDSLPSGFQQNLDMPTYIK
jgi:hypothetical protein